MVNAAFAFVLWPLFFHWLSPAGNAAIAVAPIIRCSYQLQFRPDSNSTRTITEQMQLLLIGTESEFRSSNRFARDSAKKAIVTAPKGISDPNLGSSISAMLKIQGPKFTYVIYKRPAQRQCLVYDEIAGQNYKYEEPEYPLIWKITANAATVGGYNCQMATTSFAGRAYEAWFTREIPIGDGPYKFAGLPGLIVKVQDTKGNYVFELIGLTKSSNQSGFAETPQMSMQTTKRGFLNAARANRENASNRASDYGVTFHNTDAVRLQMRENLKRANNPLELKF